MICVQVSVAAVVGSFQIIEDMLCRRLFQASFPERAHQVWFPSTIDTAPIVPAKTKDADPAVGPIIATFYGGSS